jgi:hypothetical protein
LLELFDLLLQQSYVALQFLGRLIGRKSHPWRQQHGQYAKTSKHGTTLLYGIGTAAGLSPVLAAGPFS